MRRFTKLPRLSSQLQNPSQQALLRILHSPRQSLLRWNRRQPRLRRTHPLPPPPRSSL